MAKNNKNNNKNNNTDTLKKFLGIVFSIVTVYCICFMGFLAYAYFIYEDTDPDNKTIVDKFIQSIEPEVPDRTTALIAVTDNDGTRTDGIMLVSYSAINKKISLISIPRDTQVKITGSVWDTMCANYPDLTWQGSTMKINAIAQYGKEQGMTFLEEYIEDLLAIKIDYYAKLDFEAFRYIIDSVGGIEFDVPVNMYYSDPTQDLLINLKKGLQVLDGEKSEHLLRYRTYTLGDLERVEVQQDFMKVFFDTVTNTQTILSNPTAYFTTLINYVETNFGVTDALKYLKELQNIDMNNIDNYTLPCTLDPSYVFVDKEEAQEFMYNIFNSIVIAPENILYETSFFKSIQVLNGSGIGGSAKRTQEYLQENGYQVDAIGDSTDPKEDQTVIYVKQEGLGYDLKDYFTNARVEVNPSKINNTNYDIIIVFGKNDSYVYD